MGRENDGSTWAARDEKAVCSGTIAADDTVAMNHGSTNIDHVVADHIGGSLVLYFKKAFDPVDNVYFAVAFVYAAGNVGAFLPIAFGATSVSLAGTYPGSGPWTFAIFAMTTP